MSNGGFGIEKELCLKIAGDITSWLLLIMSLIFSPPYIRALCQLALSPLINS